MTASTLRGLALDPQLITKMNQPGPRYTSYPTADRFTSSFSSSNYVQAVASVRSRGRHKPLSLYLHIPFCGTVCYYCACNKIVTKNRARAATYLLYLKREIDMHGRLFAGMNRVEQLHFGGGTPTYLSDAQMDDLMAHLRQWFKFSADEIGEYSIEVDPRTVTIERVHRLRAQGFNRISFGVQDFDPEVQKAVNRIQPESEIFDIIAAARAARFRSISIDLIYGLPRQSLASMDATLAKVITARPDRISIYNYAHLPHLFKSQRRISELELPSTETRLDLLLLCIRRLCDAGYVHIGMDHFALPEDDLAIAQRQGRLHRNFQGYSTRADANLVSCGVSGIGQVAGTYSQNAKTLDEYYRHIDNGELPIARGVELTMDDLLRRFIIQVLMCNFELSITSLETAYPITFASYFSVELEKLAVLAQDGLLSIDSEWLSISPKGRLLVRNICMVFDRYLGSAQQVLRYSKTI